MPKDNTMTASGSLTATQLEQYQKDGFVSGVRVFDSQTVSELRSAIETLEATHSGGADGSSLAQYFRVNGHIVIPLLAKLAATTAILDAAQSVLGDNLLAWSVELFIKEPGSDKTVSWHQDITYWGMGETNDEVTAWVALSDVSVEAGCMRFIPGSHTNGIVGHTDTFSASNLLSRGQEIDGIDESNARHGPLRPGEMSLHHGRCFHASGPNQSTDRRIGLAIRYVTPEVRDGLPGRDYAMLVRGVDELQGWINIAGPQGLFTAPDLALYQQILRDQEANLSEGAEQNVALYDTGRINT
ncbi:phytanoyl-CoA dioxygenase family protein [Parasedimentitalea psychrophila]|uniref:Phytanoyl-CoA dioxygenase family protein n=1 Tax=Parasedimentitalea psychrophila TaxID=2997337 RepID=A0A9Y2P7L4_9RHOB|nr:phytanoyl-CoA dioxygenase family protein [Parasedimentitalea psychrophila]WIY26148.1 phytanoyl-CoA dioxygenase family protein [Parasedimentitalea psychrophila]